MSGLRSRGIFDQNLTSWIKRRRAQTLSSIVQEVSRALDILYPSWLRPCRCHVEPMWRKTSGISQCQHVEKNWNFGML